jgi:hypothetical protein
VLTRRWLGEHCSPFDHSEAIRERGEGERGPEGGAAVLFLAMREYRVATYLGSRRAALNNWLGDRRVSAAFDDSYAGPARIDWGYAWGTLRGRTHDAILQSVSGIADHGTHGRSGFGKRFV